MQVLITIPVYKELPNKEEKASLVQCFRVLRSGKFCIFAPKSLNVEHYKKLASENDVNISFEFFNDSHFKSIQSYSKLMLSSEFYQRFSDYEYILIYQLDGWVFRDELNYWCSKGYDYIGAPWFKLNSKEMITPSGNGGVSLRKVQAFVKTLELANDFKNHPKSILECINNNKKNKKFAYNIFNLIKFLFFKTRAKLPNEDYVVVNFFPCINKNFLIAPNEINFKFSFEVNPKLLYKMNENKLPFACHAFKKYDWDFWSGFIKL